MVMVDSFVSPTASGTIGHLRRQAVVGRLVSPLEIVGVFVFRRRYRAELRRLLRVGSHMIDDIGLDLKEAVAESRKPFWQD